LDQDLILVLVVATDDFILVWRAFGHGKGGVGKRWGKFLFLALKFSCDFSFPPRPRKHLIQAAVIWSAVIHYRFFLPRSGFSSRQAVNDHQREMKGRAALAKSQSQKPLRGKAKAVMNSRTPNYRTKGAGFPRGAVCITLVNLEPAP
jgi:hypothetical protein